MAAPSPLVPITAAWLVGPSVHPEPAVSHDHHTRRTDSSSDPASISSAIIIQATVCSLRQNMPNKIPVILSITTTHPGIICHSRGG